MTKLKILLLIQKRDIMIDVQKNDDEDVVVQNSNYNNIRQCIKRIRKNKAGFGADPKTKKK